jgi:hypothetical protein
MIYSFSLQTIGICVAILLIVANGLWIFGGEKSREWLRAFPRSRTAGLVLATLAAVWTFWLIATMDLGEFTPMRRPLMIAIPIGWFLTITYVEEFLAVRALGILAQLAACPMLESAFLRPETSRLLVVVLAYIWIILGIFWIGMPYLLRDQINWLLRIKGRSQIAAYIGVAYGLLILGSAFTW